MFNLQKKLKHFIYKFIPIFFLNIYKLFYFYNNIENNSIFSKFIVYYFYTICNILYNKN